MDSIIFSPWPGHFVRNIEVLCNGDKAFTNTRIINKISDSRINDSVFGFNSATKDFMQESNANMKNV
jgi:hypothetical protein